MAMLNRARVCVIGSEDEIIRLLTRMLDNCGYLDPDEDRPRPSLQDLQEQVRLRAQEDGGEGDSFLYEMICPAPYGDAIPSTCRLTLQPAPAGLWLAVFAYDSDHRFQPHDWLDLHRRLGRPLMVAQRASEDFALEKGEVIFAGGGVQDNWDAMAECWVWLMDAYGAGMPTDDALLQMEQLETVLREEDYDMDVPALLRSCITNLEAIAMDVEDPRAVEACITAARESRSYDQLFDSLYQLMEAALWETEHDARWLACLRALLAAWESKYPEQE